jgi:hypothetical protein
LEIKGVTKPKVEKQPNAANPPTINPKQLRFDRLAFTVEPKTLQAKPKDTASIVAFSLQPNMIHLAFHSTILFVSHSYTFISYASASASAGPSLCSLLSSSRPLSLFSVLICFFCVFFPHPICRSECVIFFHTNCLMST